MKTLIGLTKFAAGLGVVLFVAYIVFQTAFFLLTGCGTLVMAITIIFICTTSDNHKEEKVRQIVKEEVNQSQR